MSTRLEESEESRRDAAAMNDLLMAERKHWQAIARALEDTIRRSEGAVDSTTKECRLCGARWSHRDGVPWSEGHDAPTGTNPHYLHCTSAIVTIEAARAAGLTWEEET